MMSAASEPYRNSFANSVRSERVGPGKDDTWLSAWAEKLRCAIGPQACAADGTSRTPRATIASEPRPTQRRCRSLIARRIVGSRIEQGNEVDGMKTR